MRRLLLNRCMDRFGYLGWADICDKLDTNYELSDIVQDELADEYDDMFGTGIWRGYNSMLDIMVDSKIAEW